MYWEGKIVLYQNTRLENNSNKSFGNVPLDAALLQWPPTAKRTAVIIIINIIIIFPKLQTPASFAQSVQELTIALQRTGDPANLNRLRPHLELLANIDPSPGNCKDNSLHMHY